MAEQNIIWNSPRRFETIVDIDGGEEVSLVVSLTTTLDDVQLLPHNVYWPAWLAISNPVETISGDSKDITATLHGTAPETGSSEALLRASDGSISSDRTFRFRQASEQAAQLEWDLPSSWPQHSDGTIVLPEVREGDEYHVTLQSNGSPSRLFLLDMPDAVEVSGDQQAGLPDGLRLDGSSGSLSGIPANVDVDTEYLFSVTLRDSQTMIPQLFSITVIAASLDVPNWYTSPGNLGILLGGQAVEIILDARNIYGKQVVFTIESGSLPSNLSLSSDGVISGTASPVSSSVTRSFTVRAQTVGDTEYRLRSFSLTVSSVSVQGVIEWQTPAGNIGTILEERRSELSVRAFLRDQPDVAISYAVGTPSEPPTLPMSGSNAQDALPAGLRLIDCDNIGLIVGRPEMGTSGDHEIAVLAYAGASTGPSHVSALRPFSISVVSHYSGSFDEVHLSLPGYGRRLWRDWIDRATVEADLLYRPCDDEFGLVEEPSIYLVSGLQLTDGFIVPYMGPHHRRFKLKIGSPEVAIVRDENGKRKYEVIYLPTYDIEEDDALSEKPPFPAAVSLLRKELLERAPTDSAPELIPAWMQQQQVRRDGQSHIGYQPALVAAYVKPRAGRVIVDRWRQMGVFAMMSGQEVEIDRYVVEEVKPGGLPERRTRTVLFPYETVEGTGYNLPTKPPVSSTIKWTLRPRRADLGFLRTGDFRSVDIAIMAELISSPAMGVLTLSGMTAQPWQFLRPHAAVLDLNGQTATMELQKFAQPIATLNLNTYEPILVALSERSTEPARAEMTLQGETSILGTSLVTTVAPADFLIEGQISDRPTDLLVPVQATTATLETSTSEVNIANTAIVVSPPPRHLKLLRFASTSLLAEQLMTIPMDSLNVIIEGAAPTLADIRLTTATIPSELDFGGQIARLQGFETLHAPSASIDVIGEIPPLRLALTDSVPSADLTLEGSLSMRVVSVEVEPNVAEISLQAETSELVIVQMIAMMDAALTSVGQTPTVFASTVLTIPEGSLLLQTEDPTIGASVAFMMEPADVAVEPLDLSMILARSATVEEASTTLVGAESLLAISRDAEPAAEMINLVGETSTLAASGDPYFSNTELLIHFDGTDGQTTSIDFSNAGRTLTFAGSAQLDTAIQRFGTASLYLNGSGSWVSTPHAAELSVANSTDMTIECFFRAENLTKSLVAILNKRDSTSAEEFSTYLRSTGEILLSVFTSGSATAAVESAAGTIEVGNWYHLAAVRISGTWTLYLNGTSIGSSVEGSTPSANTGNFNIGHDGYDAGRDFQGWIDEVRVTFGVGRYTGNFAPPDSAFPDH